MYAYISPPVMVRLSKPAQHREVPITDKTGGGNKEASVWGRTLFDVPQGTRGNEK
jgi:hypothetical protein